MNSSKTVSQYQLFCLIFITITFSAMMYSDYTVNNPDLLMLAASSVSAAIILMLTALPLFLFYKRSCDQNIIQAVQSKKPFLSGVFSAIYMLYFVYSAAVSVLVFSMLLSNFINPGLPFFAFFLLTLICCGYAAHEGLGALSRASTIFLVLIIISLIMITFSLSFRVNVLNYSHIYIEKPERLFDNSMYLVVYASSIPSIFLFVRKIKGNFKKTVISAVIASNAAILIVSLISFGVLGEYLHTTPYPFYTATQLIELGAFQRLDVIFLALWTVGMFVKTSLSLCALKETVHSSFRVVHSRWIYPVLVSLVGVTALISSNNEDLRSAVLNMKIMSVGFVTVTFILPIITVLFLGRKRVKLLHTRTVASMIAVLFILPLLTGCQKTQIQDRMIIKGIGVDKTGDEYSLTVQYVDNYSDGDKQQNKAVVVKGKTIGEAMGKIKNSSGREPFLGQNSAMIFGYETAKGSMEKILDYFIRYSEARPTVKLYISETTAEDILTLEVAGSIIPIDHMTTISPSNSKNDNLFTLLNFVNLTKNPTDTPTVAVICADENTIKLKSVAAVGGEGEIYELNEDEYIVYKTLIGIDSGTVLSFDGISGRVTDCRVSVDAREIEDKLKFNVLCKLNITILENPDNVPESEIEYTFNEKLRKMSDRSMEDIVNERQYDLYNLGRHLKFSDYKKYSDANLYAKSLKDCLVNVRVDCKTVETTR